MSRGFTIAVLAVGLVVVGCSDEVAVSREEAVEVLVIDGVPRERAVCIVNAVDGRIDLARVIGVDDGITDDELADLAGVTASCRTLEPTDGVGSLDPDSPEAQLLAEGGGVEQLVEQRIDGLVTGGLDPIVARCVEAAILGAAEPVEAVTSDTYVTEAIRVCEG